MDRLLDLLLEAAGGFGARDGARLGAAGEAKGESEGDDEVAHLNSSTDQCAFRKGGIASFARCGRDNKQQKGCSLIHAHKLKTMLFKRANLARFLGEK